MWLDVGTRVRVCLNFLCLLSQRLLRREKSESLGWWKRRKQRRSKKMYNDKECVVSTASVAFFLVCCEGKVNVRARDKMVSPLMGFRSSGGVPVGADRRAHRPRDVKRAGSVPRYLPETSRKLWNIVCLHGTFAHVHRIYMRISWACGQDGSLVREAWVIIVRLAGIGHYDGKKYVASYRKSETDRMNKTPSTPSQFPVAVEKKKKKTTTFLHDHTVTIPIPPRPVAHTNSRWSIRSLKCHISSINTRSQRRHC